MKEPPFWLGPRRKMKVLLGVIISFHLGTHLLPWRSMLGFSLPPWIEHAAWAVYIPLLILWIRSYNAGDKNTRRAIAAGEMPCWHCGYDITLTDPPGPCPECGQRFDTTETWEKWERLFGRDLRPGALPRPVQLATLTPNPRQDPSP